MGGNGAIGGLAVCASVAAFVIKSTVPTVPRIFPVGGMCGYCKTRRPCVMRADTDGVTAAVSLHSHKAYNA